ncbi:uncharacterized protein [Leptinotarsa decemlineata]|uniref:uncharacterized protein n=1 Tax=Leptinotarsa decemlineata TaxID=7539 RepID=UPI003D306611
MYFMTIKFILLFTFALRTGFSLECYSCGSQLGLMESTSNCEYFSYSSDEKYRIMQCLDTDSVCAKYIVEDNGSRWIHRSCQRYDICSQWNLKYNTGRNMLLECETCDDRNLCNSSTFRLASSFCVISSIFAVSFMK